jgi:hypothetical protein
MKPPEKAISVSVGLFSGRPNPEIVITGEAASTLAERLRSSIGKESTHPPPPPRLGFFYGFYLQVPAKLAKELEVPENFSVYSGVITEQGQREQRYWRDTGGVELFLMETAFQQGHGELLEKAGAQRLPSIAMS